MKFCQHCGKEILDDAIICPNCGCYANCEPNVRGYEVDESVNIGLVILAVIFPVFGFIYWPVKDKERPRCAKICGIAAIISFFVSFLLKIALILIVNMINLY